MFSKLVKHEWKSLFKHYSIIFLTLVLSSVIAAFVLVYFQSDPSTASFVVAPVIILYYLLLIASPFAAIIVYAIRFHSSTYGNEGYLTNTLPVKSSTILIAKILVGSIYLLLINLILFFCIFGVLYMWISSFTDIPYEEIRLALSNLPQLKELIGLSPVGLLVYFIITLILSTLSAITMVTGAVSLGQLWRKHKILGSIVSYIGIYFVIQIISTIFIFPATSKLSAELITNEDPTAFFQGYMQMYLVYMPVLSILILCGLFFLSRYILKKKINLD